ncbi:hypothetical protein ANCDUO_11501 [Ancylostoma duodenale]|uniref:Uncharacterized protein n=1 Tax=Ancylostoma duodenale TaxID=51022 RepID=A0A0C2GMN1_9BILA|nr:hypothetical protein ANCDUO_11501 [Ancylostoma duodenale]
MLFVSLERTESTGQLWLARGTNGRIAGARSVHPKINGSQGDQEADPSLLNPKYIQEESLPSSPRRASTSLRETLRTDT